MREFLVKHRASIALNIALNLVMLLAFGVAFNPSAVYNFFKGLGFVFMYGMLGFAIAFSILTLIDAITED